MAVPLSSLFPTLTPCSINLLPQLSAVWTCHGHRAALTHAAAPCVPLIEEDTAHHILSTFSPLPRRLTTAAEVSSYQRYPPDPRYLISSLSADDVGSLQLITSAGNDPQL